MCGIAGFSSFDKDYTAIENYFKSRIDILKKMRQSFAYRGNDQTGECLRRNVGFKSNGVGRPGLQLSFRRN